MAIFIVEGFNFADTAAEIGNGWGVNATPTIPSGGGRTYGNCLRCTQISSTKVGVYKNLPAINTTNDGLSFGFDVKLEALGTAGPIRFMAVDVTTSAPGTNQCFALAVDTNGDVLVYGAGGSLRATLTVGVAAATWYHFEVVMQTSVSGVANIYMDGIFVGSGSSIFDNGTSQHKLHLYKGADHSTDQLAGKYVDFDNVYADQVSGGTATAALGRTVVKPLLATSGGVNSEWTGAFTDVDDPIGSSDGDTTYIDVNTPNKISDFNVTDVETGVEVYAVKAHVEARKTNDESGSVRPIVLSSGTQGNGTDVPLTTSYVKSEAIFELNPATGTAWDVASANAMTIGVESR